MLLGDVYLMTYDLQDIKEGSLLYKTSPVLLSERSIFIAFTTRKGGFSQGPYSSLNLSFHVGDDPLNVTKNRSVIAETFGFELNRLIAGKQVHGSNIAIVDEKNAGSGSLSYDTALPDTDGLITEKKQVALMILTADCLPVILVQDKPYKIAVIHCGWKGLAAGIIEKALQQFDRDNTLVFFGPSISDCCYEVESQVAQQLGIITNEDLTKYKISLGAVALKKLVTGRIPVKNIYQTDSCCNCKREDYFSFRRDNKVTGRQAAIAVIQ